MFEFTLFLFRFLFLFLFLFFFFLFFSFFLLVRHLSNVVLNRNKTITVSDALKLTTTVVNDSNSLNAVTEKAFTVTFNFSHPLTNIITYSGHPTPYESKYSFSTT